jgi:hypothetical protein
MRRSTLLELSCMELHEVAHVRRCFAGELAHGVRHAVVTPLPGQLGHGREMPDEVFRKLCLTKVFAPRREWNVAISDGPAESLGEDARIVVQIGRFRPRQIVDLLKEKMTIHEAVADLKAYGLDPLLALYLKRYPIGENEDDPSWADGINPDLAPDTDALIDVTPKDVTPDDTAK